MISLLVGFVLLCCVAIAAQLLSSNMHKNGASGGEIAIAVGVIIALSIIIIPMIAIFVAYATSKGPFF